MPPLNGLLGVSVRLVLLALFVIDFLRNCYIKT